MATKAKVTLPGSRTTGPVKPDYMPTDAWEACDADQKAWAVDPANAEQVKAAYEPEKTDTAPPPADDIERVSVAISNDSLPTSVRNEIVEMASKISDQDRETFADVVADEMELVARTVALLVVINRAYGEGAPILPRYGSTKETANLFDVFSYPKNKSDGTPAKEPGKGSKLAMAAYSALVPLGLQNEIKEYEKKVVDLGKGAVVPFEYKTALERLRGTRNKLVKKFVFAVRLSHMTADIAAMDKVGYSFIAEDGSLDVKDDMTNLNTANSCVLLFAKNADGTRGGMQVAVSPGQLLDYRPQWAIENKDKFKSLLDALLGSIDPGTPQAPEGEKDLEFEDMEDVKRALDGAYTFLFKFYGPAASKKDSEYGHKYLLSDTGAGLRSVMFKLFNDLLAEAVLSNDAIRSAETNYRTRTERSMGGDANRQVKAA